MKFKVINDSTNKTDMQDTSEWRIIQRLDYMKKNKGSGKSITAAARKMAEITWALLTEKRTLILKRWWGNINPCLVQNRFWLP